ncbi:MAG: hypothetical protein QG673_789 [Pseudomonadota bacterium]|nr:hypothetical protein [Pseudomonadota bacterium]
MITNITDTKIKTDYYQKNRDKLCIIPMGNNLYLFVSPKGKCTFSFKIYIKGNIKSWLKLGEYPTLTTKQAQKKAIECQELVNIGQNPAEKQKEANAKNIDVRQLVDIFIERRLNEVRREGNSRKSKLQQLNLIAATIGNIKIKELTQNDIYNRLLKPLVDRDKKAMAETQRKNIKQLLNFAIRQEFLDKNVATILDNFTQKPRERNLSIEELKIFLNELYLADIKTSQKYAFHLLIMLGIRKSELTQAKWEQINFQNKTFINYQHKTSSPYTIYLPTQAIKILERLKSIARTDYIISSNRSISNKPVASTYLNNILGLKLQQYLQTKYNISSFTIHDFRRTFSTILNNNHKFDNLVISSAMGHQIKGVERHYNHATYAEILTKLWQYYADFLDELIQPELNIYNLICVE